MGSLRLHVPVERCEITNAAGHGFWNGAQIMTESGDTRTAELTIRTEASTATFDIRVKLTHVVATASVATFIGEIDGHTVAGAVFYFRQRKGCMQVA